MLFLFFVSTEEKLSECCWRTWS